MAPRRLAAIAGTLAFLFHVALNPHYGFFRDELYFILCGRHPAFGYVDQPPLIPLLAAATQLLGHSLILLRAVAAVFAGAAVYVTCLLVIELGGGRFAQLIAAASSCLCPVLANFGMKLSTDTIGMWLWPLISLYLLRLMRGAAPRSWLVVGLAVGTSAEAKYSVVYLVVAFAIGIAITPERGILRSRWLLAGAAVAGVVALPNALWQGLHGFPILELLRNGQHGKNVLLSPGGYLAAEVLITNPALALIWGAGLVWLLCQRDTRFLGYGYLVLLALMIASHAKHYYPADIYPSLFAAGGVAVERLTRRQHRLRPLIAAFILVAGVIPLPYALPVLPVPAFLGYDRVVGHLLHSGLTKTEHHAQSVLPQDWADMHGWPELAEAVTRVVGALSAEERAHAVIVASNYGEAAAIEFFGGADLPPVVSGHNQYFLWGTRGASGDVVIDVGGDCGGEAHLFRTSERAATFSGPYVMPYEDQLPIQICRGITVPLAELWPRIKNFN